MRLVIDSVSYEAIEGYRWPHKIGYVNGRVSAWHPQQIADAAARGELLALIDVLGTSPHAASILDWERGDVENPDVLRDWVIARNRFRGDAAVYCSRDALTTVINALQGEHWFLWLADPTVNSEAPQTPPPLGLPPNVTLLGIQYALEPDSGGHYDISVFYHDGWHELGRHEDQAAAAMGQAEPRTGVGAQILALDAELDEAVGELVGEAAAAAAGLEVPPHVDPTDGRDPDPGLSAPAPGSAGSVASASSDPRPVPAAALARSPVSVSAPSSVPAVSSSSPSSFRVPPGLLHSAPVPGDAGPASATGSSSALATSSTSGALTSSTGAPSSSSAGPMTPRPPSLDELVSVVGEAAIAAAAAAAPTADPAAPSAPSPLPHAWLQVVLGQVREAATMFRGAGAGHAAQLLEQAAAAAAEVGSILMRAGLLWPTSETTTRKRSSSPTNATSSPSSTPSSSSTTTSSTSSGSAASTTPPASIWAKAPGLGAGPSRHGAEAWSVKSVWRLHEIGQAMNHGQLLVHTILLAQKARLRWHYCKDSRRCEGSSGFPDLFVVGEHGAAFIELKTADDDTTAAQDGWRYLLHLNEIAFRLFRPSDLTDGTIRQFLDAMA